MNYGHFVEESADKDPFSIVFENKLQLKPYYDKINNRYYVPNPETTDKNMVISRGFMKGFNREEFVFSLVSQKITYSDFDFIIDKIEKSCGNFRILKMLFTLLLIFLLCGICFLSLFLLDNFRNIFDDENLLLGAGLGILIGGGSFCILAIAGTLKYYEILIRKDLILENERIARKNLDWKISSFAQRLILEIKA